MILSRRKFALFGLLAAPAIVAAPSLMRVSTLVLPPPLPGPGPGNGWIAGYRGGQGRSEDDRFGPQRLIVWTDGKTFAEHPVTFDSIDAAFDDTLKRMGLLNG